MSPEPESSFHSPALQQTNFNLGLKVIISYSDDLSPGVACSYVLYIVNLDFDDLTAAAFALATIIILYLHNNMLAHGTITN